MDWHVQTFASVESTQDLVKHHISEGSDEGVVIQALEQKSGRGRQGREWTSPMGNLYMSVLLKPDCPVDEAGQISFVVAVALSRAIDEIIAKGHTKTLKWPNDILIDGKKIAGILLESDLKGDRVESLAVGIGCNIMSSPPDAISVQDISADQQVPIHPFRDKVLDHLKLAYQDWKQNGFSNIRMEWLSQAHGLNTEIDIQVNENKRSGLLKDIDEKGLLILETEPGKTVAISSGDVYFKP